MTYSASGLVASSTDYDGHVTTYTHDSRGLETSCTEAYGTPQARTITTAWDPDFRLPTRIAEPGRTTTFQYDSHGNRLQKTVTSATGPVQTWTYAYDANGNRVQRTDPLGHTTAWAYDALNRVRQVIDALNGITADTYDPTGALASVTDPNGNTTTYTNDGLGDRTRVQSPDTGTSTDTYDAAGNRLTHTDARGITLTYTYDALNWLTHVDAPGSGRRAAASATTDWVA